MTKYCYSFDDKEDFIGDFDSREDALAGAASESYDNPTTVYVGEVVPAKDILALCAEWVGSFVYENLTDKLGDKIGDAVKFFVMTVEQQKELGVRIINHIDEQVGFNCFGVIKIVESEGGAV